METFIKFHCIYVSFFFPLFDVVPVSDDKKLHQKTK